MSCINKGDQIKIEAIESKIVAEVNIPELQTPIQIIGTIDRVDSCNGIQRIIDYKTGTPSYEHEDQINGYAAALVEMGYTIKDKILVYTNQTILINKI